MDKRIHIPSIYASEQLEQLLELCHPLLTAPPPPSITLDFTTCKFLAHHATTILGGIAHHLEAQNSLLILDLETLAPPIRMNLAQNGLLQYLGHNQEPWDGNSIPFRHDSRLDRIDLINYLSHSWLGKGWLNIHQDLKERIVSKVLEIYLNAFEHSTSPLGVFSCGQHYPNKQRIKLTILDLGIGIPQSVRHFRKAPDLPAAEALQWAFQQGNSTQPIANTARGVGLDIMKAFIRKNQGKLRIYSHDSFAQITAEKEEYGRRKLPFQGTIVDIDLACSSDYYSLSPQQLESEQPFF